MKFYSFYVDLISILLMHDIIETGICNYLSLLFLSFLFKCVVDKHKNDEPKHKNIIAVVVFLSIKFTIDII